MKKILILALSMGSFIAKADLTNNGTISGNGTVAGNIVNNGTISPGETTTAETFTVSGNLTNAATSIYSLQLGSATSADKVAITGAMTFAGTLNVTTLSGFTPTVGTSYTLFSYASYTGNFATLNLPTPTSGQIWNTVYGATGLTITLETVSALEVNLLSLEVKQTGKKENTIIWKTNSEKNMANFEVEKGISKSEFNPIGQVKAKNTVAENNYKFIDANATPGTNFYRIKMNEINGKSTYSKIISITLEELLAMSAFPNPFTDKLQIVNTEGKAYNVKVLGLDGKVLKTIEGIENTELSLENLVSGQYLLELNQGKRTNIVRILKANK
jgi:hypothetical protein